MAMNLKELLQPLINPQQNWKIDLLYHWKDIIGPLHNKVRIEKVQENTLILGVVHSCWMQELYLLSPLIIKTINEKLDQPYIKHIRFTSIGSKQNKKNKPNTINVKKSKIVRLSIQDEKILINIVDPVLREALRTFRMRCYQE